MSEIPDLTAAPTQVSSPNAELAAAILSRVQGLVDGKVDAAVSDIGAYLEERDAAIRAEFEKVYLLLAQNAADGVMGVGDAYREFVVMEARRLGLKASEVVKR